MKFKLGELFCGPGGMALGAKLASEEYQSKYGGDLPIEHVWGVDRDPAAIDTYTHNLPGSAVCKDAMKFVRNSSNSPQTIKSLPQIDALAFGFPCNDFSLVGEQKGAIGEYGGLYKAGIKAINLSNPKFFIAENVSGIHSANSLDTFYEINRKLMKAGEEGYNITTHLYKFEKYGIPQARHRYIIVGIRKDLDLTFQVPSPEPFEGINTSCETALRDVCAALPNSEYTKHSDQVYWRLMFTPPGENAWKLDKIIFWEDEALLDYLQTIPWYERVIEPLGSLDDIRDKIAYCKLNVKTGSKMSHIYKRLVPNKPAYTITGSGGGGTHVYHWEEPRALTNRERARLQSFPDDFVFVGKKEQVRKQIGMAVPPMGAKIIFNAILDTFAGLSYPSCEPSYSLMELPKREFRKKQLEHYKSSLKNRLKRNYEFELEEFNKLDSDFKQWIATDVFIDAAEELIKELMTLKKKPKPKQPELPLFLKKR